MLRHEALLTMWGVLPLDISTMRVDQLSLLDLPLLDQLNRLPSLHQPLLRDQLCAIRSPLIRFHHQFDLSSETQFLLTLYRLPLLFVPWCEIRFL